MIEAKKRKKTAPERGATVFFFNDEKTDSNRLSMFHTQST